MSGRPVSTAGAGGIPEAIRTRDVDAMKFTHKCSVLAAGACLWLGLSGEGAAMDPEGCLTCHQYPGMAIMKDSEKIKILHIDEPKYGASPHGRFACRECHTPIEQIPHTGETQVDCTTKCHQSAKDKRLVAKQSLNRFHRDEQSAISALQDPSSCRVCHKLYPHSENEMVRALLNLHTAFMVCEVCHLNKDRFPDAYYDWNGAEIAEFSGDPYGTFYNPKLKSAHKSKHFLSRISVFRTVDGRKRSLADTRDSAEAENFLRRENNLTAAEKKKRLDYFHRDVNKKEVSVACDECHSSDGILDFQKLGFDQKTTNNLINLNIKGLVTKYKTFYFPHLFEK